jgi:hypothetical protein
MTGAPFPVGRGPRRFFGIAVLWESIGTLIPEKVYANKSESRAGGPARLSGVGRAARRCRAPPVYANKREQGRPNFQQLSFGGVHLFWH